MLFWFYKIYYQNFSPSDATNQPFMSGLIVKGDKRASLTSFHGQMGGEK